METSAYLQAIEREGFALARAAQDNLDAAVRSCPGWRVSDLVWHTGEVHSFWATIAAGRLQDPRDAKEERARPEDDGLLEWYRAGVARLLETLSAADPRASVWTWAPQKNVAFIQRRMAQETTVHRWDAEAAAGSPKPIEARLAADGVDEFLEFFLPADPERLGGEPESVHLHATDVEGEWLVKVGTGGTEVTRGHAKGDVAARASASDLLLLLWRRVEPSAVEVHGDPEALRRFLARADLD